MFPLHPFIHLLQALLPLDFICRPAEWDTSVRKKKKHPPLCDIRSESSANTNQPDVTSSVFLHPPTPPVWLSAGRLTVNGIVVGAAEICHSSRRARSLMFRLNCYRIDVDTKVAGSENWHDRGDLVRGCRRTAVSKCDTTSYIRNSVTQNGDCRGEERGRSDTTLTLGFLSITLSVSCYHTNNLTYFTLLYSVPPLPLSFSTI